VTGLVVVGLAVVLALALGVYRRSTDGRARGVRPERRSASLDAARLGHRLGRDATVVQFSTASCAPCHGTRALLAALAARRPGLEHVDLDATEHLDLVEEFGITRTPTVLVLDAAGALRHRIIGAPREPEVVRALDDLAA